MRKRFHARPINPCRIGPDASVLVAMRGHDERSDVHVGTESGGLVFEILERLFGDVQRISHGDGCAGAPVGIPRPFRVYSTLKGLKQREFPAGHGRDQPFAKGDDARVVPQD